MLLNQKPPRWLRRLLQRLQGHPGGQAEGCAAPAQEVKQGRMGRRRPSPSTFLKSSSRTHVGCATRGHERYGESVFILRGSGSARRSTATFGVTNTPLLFIEKPGHPPRGNPVRSYLRARVICTERHHHTCLWTRWACSSNTK